MHDASVEIQIDALSDRRAWRSGLLLYLFILIGHTCGKALSLWMRDAAGHQPDMSVAAWSSQIAILASVFYCPGWLYFFGAAAMLVTGVIATGGAAIALALMIVESTAKELVESIDFWLGVVLFVDGIHRLVCCILLFVSRNLRRFMLE